MCDVCDFLKGTDLSLAAAARRYDTDPESIWKTICTCKQINLCSSCSVWFSISDLDKEGNCPDCSYDQFGVDYDFLYGPV